MAESSGSDLGDEFGRLAWVFFTLKLLNLDEIILEMVEVCGSCDPAHLV